MLDIYVTDVFFCSSKLNTGVRSSFKTSIRKIKGEKNYEMIFSPLASITACRVFSESNICKSDLITYLPNKRYTVCIFNGFTNGAAPLFVLSEDLGRLLYLSNPSLLGSGAHLLNVYNFLAPLNVSLSHSIEFAGLNFKLRENARNFNFP